MASQLATLSGSNELLQEMILGLPVPVVVSRPSDHRIVFVNAAACEYLGRSPEELLALTVDEITAPTSRRYLDGNYAAAAQDTLVFDKYYVRGDGQVVPGQVHALVRDPQTDLSLAAIVDTSDFQGASRRLGLLETLAHAMSEDADGDLDAIARRLETEMQIELGLTVHIDWSSTSSASSADEMPTFPRSEPNVGAVVQRVLAGDRQVGTLAATSSTGAIDQVGREFLSVMARYLGAVHAMVELRTDLAAAALFEAGFRSTQVGMQVVSPDGTLLRVNEAFAGMVGRPADELVGMNWRDITDFRDRHERDAITMSIADGDRPIYDEVKRYVRPDGSVVWGSVNVAAVYPLGTDRPDERVHITHVVDVTAQIEAIDRERSLRTELEASERRYRSLIEPSTDLIMRISADGRVVDVSSRAASAIGVDQREIVGARIDEVIGGSLGEAIVSQVDDVAASGEPAELWRKWIEPAGAPAGWYVLRFMPEDPGPDGEIEHVHLVASDISLLVENEQRLAAMALVDPLTGLSNRAAVFDRLQHAVDRLDRHPEAAIAVAVIDLDHFKTINDTYGHAAGDSALRAVADGLRNVVRLEDTVGRLGGDEFIVIVEDVTDRDGAELVGERISDRLAATRLFVDDDRSYAMSGSVGVAFVDRAADINDIVARADRAMYQAKRHGRSRSWIERQTDFDGSVPSSGAMLRDLAAALGRGQFELYYQPIARAVDGVAVGFEALLRWDHPESGVLPPARFLDVLMSTGQIGPVGQWVVRTAVRQLAEWQGDPATAGLSLHINASPAELAYTGFTQVIRDELAASAVDPSLLSIEVTEQALAETVVSSSILGEIASTGARLVLDDFGTGVSSLSHLRTPFLRGIKVDRSFVSGARLDHRERAIVESVISLAGALGVDVVAEGVETVEQAEWLSKVGCPHLQGWHVGYPMPLDDVPGFLHR